MLPDPIADSSKPAASPFISAEFAGEWDDLATRTGAVPYVRPGWVAAWWRAFGVGDLQILTLRKNGRLVAVLPVADRNGVVRSTTNYHTPEFGLLAEDDVAAAELARALFAGKPRRVSIAPLDPTGTGAQACRRAAENAGYKVITRPFQRSPYLEVAGNWTDYESRLSPSLVADMRRSQRQLERLGEVSVQIADGGERLEDLLDEAFAVEASGWKGDRGTAIQSSQNVRGFYSEIASWAGARGMLRLFFLRLGERALAVDYALEQDGVCHLLKGGYDPSYRRFSPGKLLMRAIVSHCFASGLSRVELHGDAEPYKLLWASAVREHKRFEAFSGSPAGRLGWFALAYGRPAAKRVLGRASA